MRHQSVSTRPHVDGKPAEVFRSPEILNWFEVTWDHAQILCFQISLRSLGFKRLGLRWTLVWSNFMFLCFKTCHCLLHLFRRMRESLFCCGAPKKDLWDFELHPTFCQHGAEQIMTKLFGVIHPFKQSSVKDETIHWKKNVSALIAEFILQRRRNLSSPGIREAL